MTRSLKTSKRRAEILCRRLVFHRARTFDPAGDPVTLAQCEYQAFSRGPGGNPGLPRQCPAVATDWAHIVPRRFSVTRCLPANAWALCRPHHELVDRDPEAKRELVRLTIGLDRWAELREKAYAGLAGVGQSPLMFWRDQEHFLEAACKANGISTTYRGT